MNRDAVIQAAYYAVLALGDEPSRRSIEAMVRKITDGKGVRHGSVLSWLAQHRGPLGDQGGTTTGTATRAQKEATGTTSGTTPEPTRARSKVLESEVSPTPSGRRSTPRLKLRTDAEIAADAVIVALEPEIRPTLQGSTWTDWRKRNRRAIVGMAQAGRTATEIVDAWWAGSDRRGYPVPVMSWIAEDLDRPPAPREDLGEAPPPFWQLVAAGKIAAPVPRADNVVDLPVRHEPDPRMIAACRALVPSFADRG